MIRIYLRDIDLILKSDNRSRIFLSYLKIRESSKQRCGGFKLQDLIVSLNVSDTSARKHLKSLLGYGYVVETKKNLYRVVSQKKIIGYNKHEKFFKILPEQVFSYNWTNISSFRALLVELRNQVNRNKRKALNRGFTVIDHNGVREKIKRQSKKEFDTLMSTTYVSTYTEKHFSTISKYRRKQSLVTYSIEKPIVVKKESVADDDSTGLTGNVYNKKIGKFLTYRKYLLFINISTRYGNVKLHGY